MHHVVPERFKRLDHLNGKIQVAKNLLECASYSDLQREEYQKLDKQFRDLENPWKDPKEELPTLDQDWEDFLLKDNEGKTVFARWDEPSKTFISKSTGYHYNATVMKAWMPIPEFKEFKERSKSNHD